ncbi:hypothetical protein D046_1960A, partial [Vibrio parahaemolyticus V-223/04]
MVERNG